MGGCPTCIKDAARVPQQDRPGPASAVSGPPTPRGIARRTGPVLEPDDGDETDTATGSAAEVVGQPQPWRPDLPRSGLAAQLQPHLVHHAQPGGADGMPEGLEAAVRVHRETPIEVEGPVEGVAVTLRRVDAIDANLKFGN